MSIANSRIIGSVGALAAGLALVSFGLRRSRRQPQPVATTPRSIASHVANLRDEFVATLVTWPDDEPELELLAPDSLVLELAPDSLVLELEPDSVVFGAEPASDRPLSAQPRDHMQRAVSGDDLDTIPVDRLGEAFLARAPDAQSEPPDEDAEGLSDIAGFPIASFDDASLSPEDAEAPESIR